MKNNTRYRARFAKEEFWKDPDSTKRGFIPVEFMGEVRFARPIFGFGQFVVPTKEFAAANRDKIAVIVEPLDENEGILAWSGMTYWEEQVPDDVIEEYPYEKLLYLDESWKIFEHSGEKKQEFTVENIVDGTKFTLNRTENEEKLSYTDGISGSFIQIDGEGNTFRDEINEITIQSSENGLIISNDPIDSRVEMSEDGIKIFDGQNKTSIISKNISLGSEDGSKEPVILGKTLVSLLQDFIKVFNSHIHPTGTGPSGIPTTNFTQQANKVSTDLEKSKSENNTTD